MAISAFNALTLTPALAGAAAGQDRKAEGRVLPRRQPRHRRRHRDAGVDAARAGSRARARRARVPAAARRDLLGRTRACPTGFVPDEDQGYIMVLVQAPPGRLARLHDEHRQAGRADHDRSCPSTRRCSRPAASASRARRRTQGIIFAQLKDFDERRGEAHSAQGDRRPAVRRVQPDHRRDGDSRSCRRRFRGSASSAASPTSCSIRAAGRSASSRAAAQQLIGAGQPDAGADGAVHAVHRRTIRSWSSTSIASRRRASACRSATSPTRCRSCSGRRT